MARFCLVLCFVTITILSLTNFSKAEYFAVRFRCDGHNEFIKSKVITSDTFRINRYYPYVVSSLNMYGRLEGRDQKKVGPFDYNEEWGHYFNKPLILIKLIPENNSDDFEFFRDDKCPSSEQRYLRSIFSEKDDLHLSLLVMDKKFKGDGPGKAIFGALLGIAIKASTAGIIDINQEIIDFIKLSEEDLNLLGHSIGEIYSPKNNLPKRQLKTVELNADLGNYVIDDGTLFNVPLNILKIETMSDVSAVFSDKGTLFENLKEYMHLDSQEILQKFSDAKLSSDLFKQSWEKLKNENNAKKLSNQCEVLRERIESDLSVLTRADRGIALVEFVNQQGLENPHLKKFCMGDKWYKATVGTDFQKSFEVALNNSNNNPFASATDQQAPKLATDTDTKSLRKVWLEKNNVQSRLDWIIKAFKSASSAGDGAVNDIANSAGRYASAPIKLRDTTGALRDDVFGKEITIEDLIYLVSSASRKKGQKIQVLGCYLNYRELNDAEITDQDWHWQLFGKWESAELKESDYFLIRIKFNNSKRSSDKGADISSLTFLNISESSLYEIANKHKNRGVSLKKTTCGTSGHPIGNVYAQLY